MRILVIVLAILALLASTSFASTVTLSSYPNGQLSIWNLPQSFNGGFTHGDMLDTFDNHIQINSPENITVGVMTQREYSIMQADVLLGLNIPYNTIAFYNGSHIDFWFNLSSGCDDYLYAIYNNENRALKSFSVIPNITAVYNPASYLTGDCNTTAISLTSAIAGAPSSIASHQLDFSIYASNSTLLPLFKNYYSNANSNDLLIDDAWVPLQEVYLGYYNKVQAFPRMILANNLSALMNFEIPEAKQFGFGANDYISYDSEDWVLTPRSEQSSIVASTEQACNDVHNAGYKFGFTPEIDVPGWYALQDWSAFNWTCINFLDLQEQSNSGNTTALIKNVTDLANIAKGANPNLIVFVQLDAVGDSTSAPQSTIEADISALSQIQGINGIIIQDLCDTSVCNSTLTTLVDYAKSINNDSLAITTTTIKASLNTTTTIAQGFKTPSNCVDNTGVWTCYSTSSISTSSTSTIYPSITTTIIEQHNSTSIISSTTTSILSDPLNSTSIISSTTTSILSDPLSSITTIAQQRFWQFSKQWWLTGLWNWMQRWW